MDANYKPGSKLHKNQRKIRNRVYRRVGRHGGTHISRRARLDCIEAIEAKRSIRAARED
jgi:hypothetical protein